MKKEYYDLTAPQKSIWLTEQYYKNTNINNVCGTFYSSEVLDFDLLKKALNIFLKNNDSFKIKLEYTNDEVKQYFSKLENIDFDVIDIKNRKEQSELEDKLASKVFDILNSLLFEIVLFRYPEGNGGFIINSHHLISDSWTNGLVANEVALIYSKIKNKESYEKDSKLSYKTYINSEKEYITSAKFEKDKKYWEEIFATVPEVATIPSMKPNESDEDLSANRLLLNVNGYFLENIKLYCETHKISLYNFFMMVFSLYLGRVSNLDNFVIGTPILNRTNYTEKQTTGMFINTLPLRINLSHDKTFLENLKEIAINSMGLLRHQKYSYQYLIEDLRKKDSNLPKLYSVLYSYQITKMNDNMDSLQHTTSWVFDKTIADDLDIHMFDWNEDDCIKIAYDYRTSKYEEQDIKDMHSRILHVINQVLENEDVLLKDIEIVTPEEKHKILYEFNNTKVDYPEDKTIVDLFEEQVEKTPDNIAVVFEDQQLTYRELNEKANQLARYLIKQGVKPGNVVGVALNKSINLAISILAVLKSSAIYMPIYVEYPIERVNYMLQDSNSIAVITTVDYLDKFKNIKTINITESNTFDKFNINNIKFMDSPSEVAYIIYTSGSTGKPKGVQVMHKNLSNFVYAFQNYFNGINYSDTFFSSTNIAFDVSIWEFFTPLLNGAKLVFNNTDIIENIVSFCNNIIKYNITALYIPPNILGEVYSILEKKKYNKISKLLVGVEPISNYTLNKYLSLNPNMIIVNGYGPTETTICATALVYKMDISSMHNVSIGKPLFNNNIYIMYNDSLSPIGIPGEIFVSGAGVSLGYLNNPQKTSESFINDPFTSNTHVYKTGDIAKWNKDGTISFIGRRDNQIKISGYRIELSEINNRVSNFSDINKSIVIYNQELNSIICYFSSNSEININDLTNYLRKFLPTYMIPKFFKQLDSFPINENGKINYKNLPTNFIDNLIDIEVPQTPIETDLYNFINKNISDIKFGINTNLFNLGLDSLFAIKLTSYIYNTYNLSIPVSNIYKNPTIKEISKLIEASESKITHIDFLDYYPISSAQKRIYFSYLRDSNSILYNIAGGIIIEGNLDVKKLEDCFKTLIKRHSSLRTHFENKNEEIVQIIDDKIDFNLDVSNSNTNDINQIYRDFVKPFDLSKAPLFRAKLSELQNKKSLLLLDMHHIISDGTSLSILMQELCALYNDQELSEKKIDYKDFTVWEQEQSQTDKFKKQKEYWVNQFENEIPLLNMPTTYPRPSVQSFEGANYHAKLSKEQFDKISKLSRKLGITPYMLMLSAYYVLLSKYTSQDDIVVGTPIVNRDMPELSNLFGMFVNTLALRNKIDHNLSFIEFSNQIKNNCMESFKNQTYPFDMLVKDLNITRDTSRNPLFDVMFVYQNNGYPEINLKDTKTKYYIPDNNISKFDLTLEVIPVESELSLRFEYCTKLFDEDFIKRLSSHYINILNFILENEDIKIADIDMLSKEEKNQILYEFNNIEEKTNNDTFITLFENQVEQHPNNVALICDNKALTYLELNEKANSLAHYLIANDVKENDIIAIMANRSLETIICMLAILKAGAAFVNMDPTYPIERTTYYLNDCKAKCILKQQNIDLPVENFDKIFNIDLNNTDIYNKNKTNPNIDIDLKSLSYIIYTSGSTGTPKGVILNHIGLANMCKAMTLVLDYLKDGPNHTLLSVTSTPFDIFVYEIVVPLSHGMKIVLANNSEHRNPKLVDALIKKYNVDVMTVTPSLMKINYDNREPNSTLANVKNMVFGGEPLSEKFVNDLKALSSDITIYNIYGPSEITVLSNVQNLDGQKEINIGPPILNTKIYVLDNDMNPVPIGFTGEIYIGGVQVGYGYLGKEDLTKQKFINNPFAEGKMFKSGDIGRWTKDGKLQCLGRFDHQIKLRGLRIELGEIEKVLESIPQIDVAVVNKIIINNKEALCGYYVSNSTIADSEIRNTLRKALPYYMVPSYFMKLDNMPYTINRKIDRKALPVPKSETNINSNINISKLDNNSQKLLHIWKKVLNSPDIGIDDNFFDVGGDSISAINAQIEAVKYGINIEYSDIFKYPTIRLLANTIKSNETFDIKPYNDDKINCLLKNNTDKYLSTIHKVNINNILIIGTTGYLGIHLIYEFLKKNSGIAYCLIRQKNGIEPYARLEDTFTFYFGKDNFEKYKNRIKIIKGDITSSNLGLSDNDITNIKKDVDTIVNSGALVKHFGSNELFENINVFGTSNIVEFCKKYNMRLLHISTISVSGNGEKFDNNQLNNAPLTFSENDLYINQPVKGIYTYTKFKAEYIVLNAINEGLNGMILRVGNITNRFSDGIFQRNFNDNAFAKRIKSFIEIGAFPDYFLEHELELTPVDLCAQAIISILNYDSACNVLHIYNNNLLSIKSFLHVLQKLNINLIPVSNRLMTDIITGILEDNTRKDILSGIIYDLDKNKHLIYTSNISLKSDFSNKYLSKIGFQWKKTNENYLEKCLIYFKSIGFINF